ISDIAATASADAGAQKPALSSGPTAHHSVCMCCWGSGGSTVAHSRSADYQRATTENAAYDRFHLSPTTAHADVPRTGEHGWVGDTLPPGYTQSAESHPWVWQYRVGSLRWGNDLCARLRPLLLLSDHLRWPSATPRAAEGILQRQTR